MTRSNRKRPDLPPIPLGFKIWFGFCAAVGLGLLALVVWAIVKVVKHVTA